MTPSDLKLYCRDRLAPYKIPAKYEFVSDLPKTQIGKVLHRVLRQTEDRSEEVADAAALGAALAP